MAATSTSSSTSSEWAARLQKRRNFELTLLRRPSETEVQTLSEDTQSSATTTASPISPKSTHSTKPPRQSFDQLQALQLQIERNAAQIEANEARMRQLEAYDTRVGNDIQERLDCVSQLNQQLSMLREMLARAERVSKGEFGLGVV